jgi:hypothetical protein
VLFAVEVLEDGREAVEGEGRADDDAEDGAGKEAPAVAFVLL